MSTLFEYSALVFAQLKACNGFGNLVYSYPYAMKMESLSSAIFFAFLHTLRKPQNKQAHSILTNM